MGFETLVLKVVGWLPSSSAVRSTLAPDTDWYVVTQSNSHSSHHKVPEPFDTAVAATEIA